jgi:hypothetical protein
MLARMLDGMAAGADNGRAAFNHAASFSRLNIKADKPLSSGIFTSVHTTGASFMAGRSGDAFGRAGFLDAGLLTLLRTCHLRLAANGGLLNPIKEAFAMPSHVRTLFQYITLAIAVIAFERNTPFIVVALAVAVFLLSHVIGGRNHA